MNRPFSTLLAIPLLCSSALAQELPQRQCNVRTAIMSDTGCDPALMVKAVCNSANNLMVSLQREIDYPLLGFITLSDEYFVNLEALDRQWALPGCDIGDLCPFNIDPARSMVLPLAFQVPLPPGLGPIHLYAQPCIFDFCGFITMRTGSVTKIQI